MVGINEYALDMPVAELPEGSLWEFDEFAYQHEENDFRITRVFPGEIFYRANNNIFLGRKCLRTIVASRHGRIYKVLFCFLSLNDEAINAFPEDAYDYLLHKHGNPVKVYRRDEWHKVYVWDGDFGIVVLNADKFDSSSVIYTSNVLHRLQHSKNRPPLDRFRRLWRFNNDADRRQQTLGRRLPP